jgi:hypothetical protein
MSGPRLIGIIFWLLSLVAASPALAQSNSQLVTTQLRSSSFADSKIGISPERKISVYLPAGYAEGSNRFPVIYYLGYFFEDHTAPFANNGAKALFDKAIAEGSIPGVIIVSADFSTPYGSSWYVNSPATGNWEDFMVRELVPHIDATYRTIANRNSRGILGDGTGGYGAIRYGMRHPNLFGSIYAMMPFGTGPSIQPTHSRPDFELMARARTAEDLGHGFSRIFTSIYQAFLPNADRAPFYFDPPARRVNGQTVVDGPVMARFHHAFGLMGLLPVYADNLKTLRGLKFDWGRQDPVADHISGAQIFANRLVEFGVPHEAEEHGGGFRDRHWGDRGRVYTDVLPFFAEHLVFAGE